MGEVLRIFMFLLVSAFVHSALPPLDAWGKISCAKTGKGDVNFGNQKQQYRRGLCRKKFKSDTGNSLHTQEPVTVASFRTWRGWRECVARDRCLTSTILASRLFHLGGLQSTTGDNVTFGAGISTTRLPFSKALSNNRVWHSRHGRRRYWPDIKV